MDKDVLTLPPEVLTLTHQLEQAKLDEAHTSLDHLRTENELLKNRLEKSESDTHEFVAFFQREVSGKDVLLKQATAKVDELTSLRDKEKKAAEKAFRERERDLKTELEALQDSSSKDIAELTMELRRVRAFKAERDALCDARDVAQRRLRSSMEERKEERDATERARILEKGALQKDYERRSRELKKEARREMSMGLDGDTMRVVADNKCIREELHFQKEMSDDLKLREAKWKALAIEAKRDVELLRSAETERAAIAVRKTKEAKVREERITALENKLKELSQNQHAGTAKLRRGLENALEEQTLDAAGLRQMVRIKQKELSKVRKAAECVLEQRTEVEQFFLDALERVKGEVASQREQAYAKDVQTYRLQLKEAMHDPTGTATFPKIRALQAGKDVTRFTLGDAEPPKRHEGRVQLSDLSAEDREHVLRLLFAKINAVHGSVQPRPSHTMGDQTFMTTQSPMTTLPSAPPPPG